MGLINLMSDTVAKPTPEMLQYMMAAEVGDDVFGEDPTVNKLQSIAAEMFGKEAALFCPSGTMTNQIALACHTSRLDEVICHEYSHIYQYETGGYAYNSGLSISLLKGDDGILSPATVAAAIKPDYDWLASSKLLVIENTSNKGGGSYYTLEDLKPFRTLCDENRMKLHLDGARIFNALAETGESPGSHGELFDSISICLSKGLGAPIGSLLIGNAAFIKKARRFRKALGGGMRQAGYLAAAGIYALENNIERLKIDNDNAKSLGETLKGLEMVSRVRPVNTNILFFELKEEGKAFTLVEELKEKGILALAFDPITVRFVIHLEVDKGMIDYCKQVLIDLDKG